MNYYHCPSCRELFPFLHLCPDGVHRCHNCKPKQPATVKPKAVKRGRIAVLNMIERELRQKMREIEANANWREGDRWSSAHFAYAQAVQIVRDHHVITRDGKPMRERT